MTRIQEDIARYHRVEQSAEFREFRTLQQIVETAAFQEKKHILLTRRYWERTLSWRREVEMAHGERARQRPDARREASEAGLFR